MVTGVLAPQYGSVSDKPIFLSKPEAPAAASPPTVANKTVGAHRTVNTRVRLEAIVDRVLLSGQAGFELFYRAR